MRWGSSWGTATICSSCYYFDDTLMDLATTSCSNCMGLHWTINPITQHHNHGYLYTVEFTYVI